MKGKENIAADALSRNRLPLFRMQVPAAVERPTPIPPPLIEMLVSSKPDWMSQEWRRLFNTSLQKVWQAPPSGPINPDSQGT